MIHSLEHVEERAQVWYFQDVVHFWLQQGRLSPEHRSVCIRAFCKGMCDYVIWLSLSILSSVDNRPCHQ